MRFWDCAVGGCASAGALDIGSCERCRSVYCATHATSTLHACERRPLDDEAWTAAQTAELVALRAKINHAALLQRVKMLAGGLECHLDDQETQNQGDQGNQGNQGEKLQMGGMHVHLPIQLADGTVWLARILRDNYTSFSDELSNQILLSECATLRWLEPLDLPTPRLHGYGLRGDPDNHVGVAYMIIDRLPGRPFDSATAELEQKAKVLRQWARVLCVLGAHPFASVGSLKFGTNDTIEMGPIASDRTGTLSCIGPFETAKEYYRSWVNSYLGLIADRQLFSLYPNEAYLMFKFMQERIETGNWLLKWDGLNSGPFFLKHMDDKGDHILVDDDFNITGIIDWTFARTVPAYEAFGPSLMSANSNDLFCGKPGLSEEDKILGLEIQRHEAPHCYFESDDMRRFLFGPGLGLGLVKDEAFTTFQALVMTFESTMREYQEWRQTNLETWTDDIRPPGLCQTSPEDTLLRQVFGSVAASNISRFATCSWMKCGRPSVRGQSCPTCRSHLCAIHRLPRHHKCQSSELLDDDAWEMGINKEVKALLAQVDDRELAHVASSLRRGQPCKFIPGKHLGDESIMGCANYHGWIVFDDGVKWLARIPRTTEFSDIPLYLVDYLIESEYATLKILENLGVPTPKAHGYGLSSDSGNSVGVGYILEDAMPGRPFYAYQATAEQKMHVLSQYADNLIKMSCFATAQACSVVPHDGETKEDAIASNRFLSLGKYGPFSTVIDYFSCIADLHLDLISDGQIYPNYPKEAFLFYRLLRDRVSPLLASNSSPSRSSTDGFFLKHVDDKGDHILIDENHNITAIIDWQFARFVPACEAFGPSLMTADLQSLYGSEGTSPGLSPDDVLLAECFERKGRKDLADLARGSELVRRFHFGLASGLSKEEVLRVIKAVLVLLRDDDIGQDASMEELSGWVDINWDQACDDTDTSRRKNIEKLTEEIENEE
ncbi:hypothetical protein F4777DRAFT_585215 [Nemania sp. FL0916]|nr:hypothetical protein F4777DRAFT_585215 [Nemania sp. FL0916]